MRVHHWIKWPQRFVDLRHMSVGTAAVDWLELIAERDASKKLTGQVVIGTIPTMVIQTYCRITANYEFAGLYCAHRET